MTPKDSGPVPVPPSKVAIKLPQDQYLHPEAPTEWWWHTGTLVAGDRVFGFEINAASFTPLAFTEVMLTDVAKQLHFQKTATQNPANWAESDPSKDWYARLGTPGTDADWIAMTAPQADPTNMSVKAQLTDEATGTVVTFDLVMAQEGSPFIVWGSGVNPTPPNPGGVTTNNYYYSLTRLQASGTICYDGQTFDVSGQTWMDHEYGLFGTSTKPILWYLQDMQLSNGVHISNSMVLDASSPVVPGQPHQSNATIQCADGTTYFTTGVVMTPGKRTWTAPNGQIFYLDFLLEIAEFDASISVTTSMPDQAFDAFGSYVYEGVATAAGTFQGEPVTGTAWNEQRP
ncbi:MAG: hypothetical protein JNL35_01955 [Sphingopyxis sp.]|nr:hypothetical protein [Sphingopyxis sp.]